MSAELPLAVVSVPIEAELEQRIEQVARRRAVPFGAARGELLEAAREADGLLISNRLRVNAELFDHAPSLRVVAGVLEFVPGLFTLFAETSPDPLFTSQDESQALYSKDWGPCPIRIGVEYNTINQ